MNWTAPSPSAANPLNDRACTRRHLFILRFTCRRGHDEKRAAAAELIASLEPVDLVLSNARRHEAFSAFCAYFGGASVPGGERFPARPTVKTISRRIRPVGLFGLRQSHERESGIWM